jgi:chorismate-pyruvate lyase
LASPARIVDRAAGAEQPPTDEQRQLLRVSATELVRYRRVRLICGDHVLSEADNWYVPARLTPEMNRLLDTTDIAFGRVVQPLKFRRRTLSASRATE